MSSAAPLTNTYGQPIGPALPSDFQPALPPSATVLRGRYCRLERLSASQHAAALSVHLLPPPGTDDDDDRDWTYLPYARPSPAELPGWLSAREATADPYYFAVVCARTAQPLGILSYLRVDPSQSCTEIGHVLLGPSLQRTRIATEAFRLLLAHAFEDLRNRRVEWKCDALHARSRRAALRLGFTHEGVFAKHQTYKGRSRDTAWFSMVDAEWPSRKAALDAWLAEDNFDEQGRQRRTLEQCREACVAAVPEEKRYVRPT